MSTTDTVICPNCGETIPTDYVVCPYDGYSLVKELREKIRTKIKLREGIGRAYRLLRNPIQNTATVMDEVATNFDRKGPLFVLYIFSFLFAFRLAAFSSAYVAGVGAPIEIGFFLILGIVSGFLLGFVLFFFTIIFWYLITILIHFGSRFLSGTASFKESQSVVGYAFAPFIYGLLILNLLLLFLLPTGNIISTGPSSFFASVGLGYSDSAFGLVTNLHLIIFLPFAAWFIYICAVGLEKIHSLSRPQAIILPTGFILLLTRLSFSYIFPI